MTQEGTIRGFLFVAFLISIAEVGCPRAHADDSSEHLEPLIELLGQVDDAQFQLDLLTGMLDGLKGRRSVPMPNGWTKVYPKLAKSSNATVREKAKILSLVFGDANALEALREKLMDRKAPTGDRLAALAALVEKKDTDLPPMLHKLVGESAMRGAAIRGLAGYSHGDTPRIVLAGYAKYSDNDKRDAVNTLVSRVPYAKALLDAVEAKKVPARDLQAFTVRQMLNLNDKAIADRLKKVWGEIRETSRDKTALKSQYLKTLTPKILKKANLSNGRLLYSKTCGQCHVLHDDGGKVGPDLTGSNRHNMDYLLDNILDPSAVVGKDYQMVTITKTDFQRLSGLIMGETDRVVRLRTLNEEIVIPKAEIEERSITKSSMMPEGLLTPMKPNEVRDLIGYLRSHQQIPLAAEKPSE